MKATGRLAAAAIAVGALALPSAADAHYLSQPKAKKAIRTAVVKNRSASGVTGRAGYIRVGLCRTQTAHRVTCFGEDRWRDPGIDVDVYCGGFYTAVFSSARSNRAAAYYSYGLKCRDAPVL